MSQIYTWLIWPLEAAMALTLDAAYAATGSYGAAILLLSFAVNLALLPLYHLAEVWQQAERRAQQRIKPRASYIRASFSGEERYMMLRTLHRQSGYHPIQGIRVSFGLLIQIPFFFAAYQLLSHHEALESLLRHPAQSLEVRIAKRAPSLDN